MANDNPKKNPDQGAQPQPGNGQAAGSTSQQDAAIKALAEILEALKNQAQGTPTQQPFDGPAKAAVDEFNEIKTALEGPEPVWALPPLSPKIRL